MRKTLQLHLTFVFMFLKLGESFLYLGERDRLNMEKESNLNNMLLLADLIRSRTLK